MLRMFVSFFLSLAAVCFGSDSGFLSNKIAINVPLSQVPTVPHQRATITCTGFIDQREEQYIVIFDGWERLLFSPEEQIAGVVNILSHFHELIPEEGTVVGLITEQNGMNTAYDAQVETSEVTMQHIPEGTLYISLYNPTEGFFYDLWRLWDESAGVETPAVTSTRQFLAAILEQVHETNPDLLWLHISHSEGGLICHNAIQGMTPEQQVLLREHLYSVALASARPISPQDVFEAVNIYSDKDYFSELFVRSYLSQDDYNIKFSECKSSLQERTFYCIDHRNLGPTYQECLHEALENIRKAYAFYDPKAFSEMTDPE